MNRVNFINHSLLIRRFFSPSSSLSLSTLSSSSSLSSLSSSSSIYPLSLSRALSLQQTPKQSLLPPSPSLLFSPLSPLSTSQVLFGKKREKEKKEKREKKKQNKDEGIKRVSGQIRESGSPQQQQNQNQKHQQQDQETTKAKTNKRGEGNPTKTILSFKEICKNFGERKMLDHVSGSVYAGAKIGILGINGAGKSTFLKILAGEDTEYDGQLDIPSSLKVGYLSQEPSLSEHLTVEETLKEALEEGYKLWDGYIELQNLYRTQTRANSEERKDTESKMNKIKKKLVEKNWTNLDKRVQRALVALRCPPSDSIVKNLSGGERRRIALCSILLQSPDILLLDEPTNHLDAESVAYLERFLREYRGTVLAVTHDRFFLENSAGWILEVADGHLFPHKGNYTGWLESKQKRIEMEEKKDRNLQKFLKRELEWIRKPAKARQAKSQARVKAYEKLADTAREKRWESGQIKIPPGRRLGKVVLDVDNLSKSFEDGKCLFKDLSFVVPPGSIVGIVGPNEGKTGAGKTTLLRTLLGEIEPDSGKVSLGETVDIGYVSQSRASLDENSTVHEEISNGVDEIDMGGGHMINSRFYTACFHFKGKDQNKGIKYLSGGERNRVHLAKMLNRGYNLIVLDEPTNDLDIEVLSSLEDALSDFAGSSIIVSHDRWFLNRVCTHILCFDGTGNVEFFEGNYSDFMESNQAKVQKKQKYITLGI